MTGQETKAIHTSLLMVLCPGEKITAYLQRDGVIARGKIQIDQPFGVSENQHTFPHLWILLPE